MMTNQDKKSRYDIFCKELTDLCRRHGVQLYIYDGCQVGVTDMDEDGEAINAYRGVCNDLKEAPSPEAAKWIERARRTE